VPLAECARPRIVIHSYKSIFVITRVEKTRAPSAPRLERRAEIERSECPGFGTGSAHSRRVRAGRRQRAAG